MVDKLLISFCPFTALVLPVSAVPFFAMSELLPLKIPTAIFLLVVLCALIYSHILVKRSSDDSDAD